MDGGEIVIVGLGPGPLSLLTTEARAELETADKVFFRMKGHPVYRWLSERGTQVIDFTPLYSIAGWDQATRYRFMADAVLKEARRKGLAVYALPGNPHVFETTSTLLRRAAGPAGLTIRVLPGLSFLELIYIELQLDPGLGLQIYNSWHIDPSRGLEYNPRVPMLLGQVDPGKSVVGGQVSLQWVEAQLLQRYPPDHRVHLIWLDAQANYQTFSQAMPLAELAQRAPSRGEFASLYVPEYAESIV